MRLSSGTSFALARASSVGGVDDGPRVGVEQGDVAGLPHLQRTSLVAEAGDVGVIGFHGHTVAHRPERCWTWQIGDGAALAGAFGIDVVADLRSADVEAGGQGAPLLPIYHRALAHELAKPVAVLNLGGVANITAIGPDGELVAFDTGMASGLIDNWMQAHGAAAYDAGGAVAAKGRVDEARLAEMLADPWFAVPPPKSIDREAFSIAAVRGLELEDGAATLTAFSAAAVATVVGFGGTVALVVQAGQAMGAAPAQIISMVTALCLGIGLPGAVLSWRLKIPIVLAWSTPGAALLAASTLGLSWPTAVGDFVFAALLMILTGLIPVLGRLAARIPAAIASAVSVSASRAAAARIG